MRDEDRNASKLFDHEDTPPSSTSLVQQVYPTYNQPIALIARTYSRQSCTNSQRDALGLLGYNIFFSSSLNLLSLNLKPKLEVLTPPSISAGRMLRILTLLDRELTTTDRCLIWMVSVRTLKRPLLLGKVCVVQCLAIEVVWHAGYITRLPCRHSHQYSITRKLIGTDSLTV